MIWRATLVTRVVWRAFWNKFEVSRLNSVYLVYNASNFRCFGFRNRIKNSATFIELRVSSYLKNKFVCARWKQEETSCSIDSSFIDKKATLNFIIEQPCCLVDVWKHFGYWQTFQLSRILFVFHAFFLNHASRTPKHLLVIFMHFPKKSSTFQKDA